MLLITFKLPYVINTQFLKEISIKMHLILSRYIYLLPGGRTMEI